MCSHIWIIQDSFNTDITNTGNMHYHILRILSIDRHSSVIWRMHSHGLKTYRHFPFCWNMHWPEAVQWGINGHTQIPWGTYRQTAVIWSMYWQIVPNEACMKSVQLSEAYIVTLQFHVEYTDIPITWNIYCHILNTRSTYCHTSVTWSRLWLT